MGHPFRRDCLVVVLVVFICSCFPFVMVWVLLRSRGTTSIFDDANSGVPKPQVPAGTCVSLLVHYLVIICKLKTHTPPTLSLHTTVVFDESINLPNPTGDSSHLILFIISSLALAVKSSRSFIFERYLRRINSMICFVRR
jgi:hypothetical protein